MAAEFDSDGFKKINSKRKLRKSHLKDNNNKNLHTLSDLSLFNEENCVKRILDAKLELSTGGIFESVTALLKEGLSAIEEPVISEIVCFGLGQIGECTISRYQFALLLCLKELYNVDVYAYDPIFGQNDVTLLNRFKVKVLKENFEGKYRVTNKTTLFYLPHCPKQLSNNLLWANWGLNLSNCVIIANSFDKIIENSSLRVLEKSGEYILKIVPYVLELAVINNFKYFEVFNDTAIHVFPKLNLLPIDFWKYNSEPEYLEEDVEFIRNNVDKLLI